MSDQDRPNQKADGNQQTSSSRPSHLAYTVREGQNGESYFNRVGAVFPHKDGEGYNIQLDATPVDGKLTVRSLKDRLDQQRSGEQRQASHNQGERGRDE